MNSKKLRVVEPTAREAVIAKAYWDDDSKSLEEVLASYREEILAPFLVLHRSGAFRGVAAMELQDIIEKLRGK